MKNQSGSSRVDTVLKMLMIAFVSLLAFSSGVWFGKSLSDSDHKLKALESDFSNASKTAKADAKKEEGQEDPLAEEEVASLSEKFVTDQREELGAENKTEGKTEGKAEAHAEVAGETKGEGRKVASEEKPVEKAVVAEPKHAAAHEHEHATVAATNTAATAKTAAGAHVAKSEKPDLTAAHVAANRIAQNAPPTEEAAVTTHEATSHDQSRAPSSALPKTVGTAGEVEFTVQVASYPTADAAKVQADELVKKGFPAFPVEATVNGRTWFRVSVGSFKTMKEATTYRAQLLHQADLKSAIVQRIQR